MEFCIIDYLCHNCEEEINSGFKKIYIIIIKWASHLYTAMLIPYLVEKAFAAITTVVL